MIIAMTASTILEREFAQLENRSYSSKRKKQIVEQITHTSDEISFSLMRSYHNASQFTAIEYTHRCSSFSLKLRFHQRITEAEDTKPSNSHY